MAKKNGSCRGVYERVKDSGVWWIRYVDQDGKLHREKAWAKALAIDLYRKRKTEIREGKFFPEAIGRQRVVLFSELVEDFLAHSKTNKRSYENDKGRVRPLLNTFGRQPACGITPQHIDQFKASLNGRAPATIKHHLDLLRSIYNLGIRNQKVKDNPMRNVKKIKLNNSRVRYFVDDEEDRLFAALPERYHNIAEVALLTGLRASNFLGLEWVNIDLNAGVCTIPQTKSGEALRLPLHARVKEILASLPRNGQYVFPGPKGQPIWYFTQIFAKAIRKAGIPNFHLHDLRHTWASRLAMAGINLLTIKELGGWKTLAMVQRYAHLSPGHLRDALNCLPASRTDTTTRTSQVTPPETNTEVNGNSAPTAGSASNADPA